MPDTKNTIDTKKIERRLKLEQRLRVVEEAETAARRNRKPPRPIPLGDPVPEDGMYRVVPLGPDTYLAKGRRARLHNVEIGLIRIDN